MKQHTYCRFCLGSCGLRLKSEDGTIKARGDKKNKHSRGYICKKGANIGSFYGNDGRRIKKFVHQKKVVDERTFFNRLSKDLGCLIEQHGPDAVGVYFGTHAILDSSGIWAGMSFLYQINSHSFFTVGSIDNIKKVFVAHEITRGANPGAVNVADETFSDFCLIVGSNPIRSNGHLYSNINFRKRLREHQKGGNFSLCIDPRRTETAKASSLHLGIKPNTDHVLLSFFLKSIFDAVSHDELLSRLFGEGRASELAQLKAACDQLSLSNTAQLCGIEEMDLKEAVTNLISSSRLSFMSGTGVSFAENGILTEWLLYVLCAIKGGFGRQMGNGFLGCSEQEETALDLDLDNFDDFCFKLVGKGKVAREMEMPCSSLTELVDNGELKALIVLGGNPVASFPGNVNSALSSLDVLVTINTHHDQTTMLANYVCPVAGPLEREDSTAYVSSNIASGIHQYTEAVLPVEGDVMCAWEFFSKLGDRLGVDVIRLKKHSSDISTKEVIRTIGGFKDFQFNDNQSKNEATRMSLVDISLGRSPNLLSPNFVESLITELQIASSSQLMNANLSKDVFFLISGRLAESLNSADICDTTDKNGENTVYMSYEDINALGINAPSRVGVVSISNGVRLEGNLLPTADLKNGCIWIPQSDNSTNVSSLCDNRVVCDKTAMPIQTGFPVRVELL